MPSEMRGMCCKTSSYRWRLCIWRAAASLLRRCDRPWSEVKLCAEFTGPSARRSGCSLCRGMQLHRALLPGPEHGTLCPLHRVLAGTRAAAVWTSADTDAVLCTERRAPHRIMPLYTLPDGPFVALEGTRGRLALLSLLDPNGSFEPLRLESRRRRVRIPRRS